MNKIKMIAIDMDGTWLRNDCTISEKTSRVIQRAVDAGYLVVPTTGRSYRNAATVLKDYHGLEYFNNANGSVISDGVKEEIIHAEYFPYETAKAIYDLIVQYESFTELYEGMDAYVDAFGKEYLMRAGLTGEYVEQLLSTNITKRSLDEYMENPVRKISKFHIVCSSVDLKNQLKSKIEKIEGVHPISVISKNIEIVNGTWSKADGLQKLTDYLQIPREQVLAIGDSNNDLDMLKWAGTSVAMGNAPEHIQKVSDYVTATNEEDGIAQALQEYLDI